MEAGAVGLPVEEEEEGHGKGAEGGVGALRAWRGEAAAAVAPPGRAGVVAARKRGEGAPGQWEKGRGHARASGRMGGGVRGPVGEGRGRGRDGAPLGCW